MNQTALRDSLNRLWNSQLPPWVTEQICAMEYGERSGTVSTFPPTDRHYPYGFGDHPSRVEAIEKRTINDVAKVTKQAEIEKKKVLATQVAKYFGIEVRNVGVTADHVYLRTADNNLYRVDIGKDGVTPYITVNMHYAFQAEAIPVLIKQGFWT